MSGLMGGEYPFNEKLAQVETAGRLDVRNREIVPNLKAQRQELMKRVDQIDKLLKLLEEHPEFQTLYNLTRELL